MKHFVWLLLLFPFISHGIVKELNKSIVEPTVLTETPKVENLKSKTYVSPRENFTKDMFSFRLFSNSYNLSTTATSGIGSTELEAETSTGYQLFWQLESGAYFQPFMLMQIDNLAFANLGNFAIKADSDTYFTVGTGLRVFISERTNMILQFDVAQNPFVVLKDGVSVITRVALPIMRIGITRFLYRNAKFILQGRADAGASLPKDKADVEVGLGTQFSGELSGQYWFSKSFFTEAYTGGLYSRHTVEGTGFATEVTRTIFSLGLNLGYYY